jgi:hypothetical protein
MSTLSTDRVTRYSSPNQDRFIQKSLVLSNGRITATLDLILTTNKRWDTIPESRTGSGWVAVSIPWGMVLGLRIEA